MKFLRVLIPVLAVAVSCTGGTGICDPDIEAANALASRVMGAKASWVEFEKTEADTLDLFTLNRRGRKVIVGGNNANSMAVGLNYYLRQYCHADYGWMKGDDLTLPARAPKIEEPVRIEARVGQRFFLNYCTFGYTMPWWRWSDWEHFIDWMALNGINLPLAITGQESIWFQIWTELGLSEEEVLNYFTGPAHLPWHRMQNIDRWFAPVPRAWLDGQLELQKQITARERELNMKPVLPAFSGHVPRELARIFPDAPLTQLEPWAGYDPEYACTFLDPTSELYARIQKMFISKETEIYGTDHIYGMDVFNELMPPSWEPEYLGRVSRQIDSSLKEADPEGIWLQMAWLFFHERKYWTKDRVEAYLTSFPAGDQMLLDYYCDYTEVWRKTDSFFGVPFIWCYLGNFGGNTAMVGNFADIDGKLEKAFVEAGSNMKGIGATLEGFSCNPYFYEFLFEKAWNIPGNTLEQWTERNADIRFGRCDESAREAWKSIVDSVYLDYSTPGQACCIHHRPNVGKSKARYTNSRLKYDNATLVAALGKLIEAKGKGSAYEFDLVNMTRQMLSNHFGYLKGEYDKAYEVRDRAAMDSLSQAMVEVMDDVDRVVGTQSFFLLGKWLEDARSWGLDTEEQAYYERNARNLITSWSDSDMQLNDYASRTWNGLVSSYYKPRWEMFFKAVTSALDECGEWDEAHYEAFHRQSVDFENRWWNECRGQFPSSPVGDSESTVREIYAKYAHL